MAQNYVKIPKDLSLIKQKFILGLTKRQAISFGIGAVMGFTAFYICNTTINFQAACFALGICAFPAIFCGIFNKNGMLRNVNSYCFAGCIVTTISYIIYNL